MNKNKKSRLIFNLKRFIIVILKKKKYKIIVPKYKYTSFQ
jgi:hypothetical protein